MIAALLLGSALVHPAADLESSIQDPGRREEMRLCVPALSERAGGEVVSIKVTNATHSGKRTMLRGEMRVLLRPPPPRPGEMAPLHIINAHFAYQCWLKGSKVVRTRLSTVPN